MNNGTVWPIAAVTREMEEVTVNDPVINGGSDADIIHYMFVWLAPVAIGVPGNVLAILIAARKNNRNLSPCIYMMAMGVADNILLLEVAWSVTFNGYFLRKGIIKSPTWVIK